MHRRRVLTAAAAGSAAAGLLSARPAAAQLFGPPEPDLWARWQAHDPTSGAVVDHSAWTRILQRHVRASPDGINRVDYRALAADRGPLDGYVAGLTRTAVSDYARDEQFAYWVNLYNALTVQVILDHYPVDSIMDIGISPGLFARGPWGAELVEVEGRALTLNDIEHRILRPIWRDERVHYAVNCASLGCPNLRRRAFAGADLEAMLEAGARDYVNHPRGAEARGNGLFVSSIYVWFQEDFGDSDSGVIRHLRRYARPEKAERLNGLTRIADHDYDWALNDIGDGA
jgi:hypothetical protein